MGAGGTWAINWEGRGTGVKDYVQLGDGYYQRNSATSVFCSDLRVCCSDLVGVSTGGRDSLFVLVC